MKTPFTLHPRLAAILLLLPVLAQAAPVTLTFGTSGETLMEDFSTMTPGAHASYDGNGLTAAESFVGLTVTDPGGTASEFFSGSPTNPLALDIGVATTGVFHAAALAGLAGGTAAEDIGEGVVAVLFDYDIFELGLSIIGSNPGGAATFFFYASNGALVDTIITGISNGDLTFTSTTAFRGVAIQNTDLGGIGYNNFRFASASVPDGGMTLTLLGLALAGLGLIRRRQ